VNDIGRCAEFIAKLGQFGIEILIFDRPTLAVLRIEDVLLGVMDDLGFASLRKGSLVVDQDTDKQGRRNRSDAYPVATCRDVPIHRFMRH